MEEEASAATTAEDKNKLKVGLATGGAGAVKHITFQATFLRSTQAQMANVRQKFRDLA